MLVSGRASVFSFSGPLRDCVHSGETRPAPAPCSAPQTLQSTKEPGERAIVVVCWPWGGIGIPLSFESSSEWEWLWLLHNPTPTVPWFLNLPISCRFGTWTSTCPRPGPDGIHHSTRYSSRQLRVLVTRGNSTWQHVPHGQKRWGSVCNVLCVCLAHLGTTAVKSPTASTASTASTATRNVRAHFVSQP